MSDKKWKWNGQYPVRCKIVDVEGQNVGMGIIARTPDKSKRHLEKEGTAILTRGVVQITLDDGGVIYGHECWWEPMPPKEEA